MLTGGEKVFAAGVDIGEMKDHNWPSTHMTDMISWWDSLTKLKTPLIGAINGYCLGGGNEIAMMCDILIAGEKARFG